MALATLIFVAGMSGTGFCGAVQQGGGEAGALSQWWNGKYFTGDWLGVRGDLSDRGIEFKGKWEGVYCGVVDSQRGARGFFDQELAFDAKVDVEKLTGSDAAKGWSAFGGGRWRDSRASANPNSFVEGNPMFNPARFQSGVQWRLTHFGLGYVSPEMFGVKEFLSCKGGWLQPQKDFLVQPLSLLFTNLVICSSKGLSYNMPWSSSLSTWGGSLQVKPMESAYIKAGLYMACPQITASGNHGLAYAGYAPNPSLNGLLTMVEAGWTPGLGDSRLPGKYAVGGYYHGVKAVSFDAEETASGVYGFYFQADQMLYREPAAIKEDGSGCGKSFKAPVGAAPPSDQGLSMFNLLTFAPPETNLMTFYFQSGLVYKGLIPGRDSDQAMCAIAYGNYSSDRIDVLQERGVSNQANFTALIEAGYRIELNHWAFVQPYVQYLIHPNGTAAVANATVLGFMAGLAF